MMQVWRWILVAVTVGVLAGCADMSSSIYESTPVMPVSIPPSAGD